MIDGYDSTIIANIPADAGAVVCYADGRFRNVDRAIERFPHLATAGRIIALTVGLSDAHGIDIEPGNSPPTVAARWYRQQQALGRHRPVFYADRSDMLEVIANLDAGGIPTPPPGPGRPTRLFSAHPNGERHICGPRTCGLSYEMDATQWWWSSIQGPRGPDLDRDVFRDDFFLPLPGHPTNKETPMAITATQNADGRLEVFVEKQDTGEVFHTWQEQAGGGWIGAQQGVRNAAWHSLGTPGK